MNQQIPFSIARQTKAFLGFLMLAGFLSMSVKASEDQPTNSVAETGQSASASEIVVFSDSEDSTFWMMLGSSTNWSVPVQGPKTTSYKSKIVTVTTADYLKRDDAYQVEWKGGLGQVYWQRNDPIDLTEMADKDAALSMVVRIDKAPKKSVDLKMDCGYPCAGTLSMTRLFQAVPVDQWFRLSFKLSCFKEAGANLTHIAAPLVVATKGSFKMSFGDVRIMTNPPQESLVDCG
jgi:beta-glucosidase